MKSTESNIKNPTSILELDLLPLVEAWKYPQIMHITKEGYDLMRIHDPHIIYIIHDEEGRREIRYGDLDIHTKQIPMQYVLGSKYVIDTNSYEYIVYKCQSTKDSISIIPIEICRFNNYTDAVEMLDRLNGTGIFSELCIRIYKLLVNYINEEIGINELIIGCLCVFGYKDHPDLQKIIQTAISYGTNNKDHDLPILFREELPNIVRYTNKTLIAGREANPLIQIYANIYNIIISYNFFKDPKYHKSLEEAMLKEPVSKIIETYISHIEGLM